MPLIRYPTGDLAQWTEPPGSPDRKFSLLGRAGQGVRIATYNVGLSEVAGIIEPWRERLGIEHFQLVVAKEGTLDRLTLRMVGQASLEALAEGRVEMLRAFHERRSDLEKAATMGVIHSFDVAWVGRGQMAISERTGKMLAVVDQRRASE